MPTDNPKISLYVPQQIYDRFKSFQEEQNLSMSQAGIVILAEYFGLEETIREITEGTTIGGVTLAEFERLKQRIKILEDQVSLNQKSIDEQTVVSIEHQIEPLVEQSKTTSGLQAKNGSIERAERINLDKTTSKPPIKEKEHNSKPQLKLLSEPNFIKPIPASHLSKKRFGLGKDTLASYKRKHNLEELTAWTKEKDPDSVSWVMSSDSKGYVPESGLPHDLLNKLQKWIEENI